MCQKKKNRADRRNLRAFARRDLVSSLRLVAFKISFAYEMQFRFYITAFCRQHDNLRRIIFTIT